MTEEVEEDQVLEAVDHHSVEEEEILEVEETEVMTEDSQEAEEEADLVINNYVNKPMHKMW